MSLPQLSAKELDGLKAIEVDLTDALTDDTLPFETRNDLVRRLNVIRAKLALLTAQ